MSSKFQPRYLYCGKSWYDANQFSNKNRKNSLQASKLGVNDRCGGCAINKILIFVLTNLCLPMVFENQRPAFDVFLYQFILFGLTKKLILVSQTSQNLSFLGIAGLVIFRCTSCNQSPGLVQSFKSDEFTLCLLQCIYFCFQQK